MGDWKTIECIEDDIKKGERLKYYLSDPPFHVEVVLVADEDQRHGGITNQVYQLLIYHLKYIYIYIYKYK
jgi:hypothetical protein